jgi:hypothetical protein
MHRFYFIYTYDAVGIWPLFVQSAEWLAIDLDAAPAG